MLLGSQADITYYTECNNSVISILTVNECNHLYAFLVRLSIGAARLLIAQCRVPGTGVITYATRELPRVWTLLTEPVRLCVCLSEDQQFGVLMTTEIKPLMRCSAVHMDISKNLSSIDDILRLKIVRRID